MATSDDDVAAVVAAARERAAALAATDLAALRRLLHPGMRWTTYRGTVLDRERYLAGNDGTDGLVWRGQSLEDVEVEVVGDTAVLTARVVDDVTRAGTDERFVLRLTQTWVRTPDGWRLLAGHAGPRVDGCAQPDT